MISASRVTVTTSATAITSPDLDDWSTVLIRNRGAVSVYLGAASVTSATGYQLDAGEALAVDPKQFEALYGITASSTAECHVLLARS